MKKDTNVQVFSAFNRWDCDTAQTAMKTWELFGFVLAVS